MSPSLTKLGRYRTVSVRVVSVRIVLVKVVSVWFVLLRVVSVRTVSNYRYTMWHEDNVITQAGSQSLTSVVDRKWRKKCQEKLV